MYNKLFTKILDSSIWLEMTPTRIVWITLLAAMDQDGYAHFSAIENLALRARVTTEEARVAVDCFLNPDPNSEDQEHEGRRVERIPGGFIVLNAAKYRELVTSAVNREKVRERVKKHRAKHRSSEQCNAHVTQSEAEAEAEANTKKKEDSSKPLAKTAKAIEPPPDQIEIRIPTNKNGHEFPILKNKVKEWVETYPGVDVPRTLKEIRQWCLDNPSKRKTERGMHAFVGRWMAREQNGGHYG